MDTSEMWRNYASVIELARGGGFRAPAEGWSAEQVIAHLAANDELFLAVGEAIGRGERPDYDNLASVTEWLLERRVAEAGGMAALVDKLEATSARLIVHAESLTRDEAAAQVRFHVFHDGHTLVDEVRSWGDIVAGQGNIHIPIHIRQLRALTASQ